MSSNGISNLFIFLYHLRIFYNGRCTFIFRFEVGKPCVRAGIGRHAPVATRTERAAAHLGPIGQARTLELLGEETAEEGAQPFENNLIGVRRAIACAVMQEPLRPLLIGI